MKARDLIERLQQEHPDTEVYVKLPHPTGPGTPVPTAGSTGVVHRIDVGEGQVGGYPPHVEIRPRV